MEGLRFVVANCIARHGKDAYTTTVTTSVDAKANVIDVNQSIREQASAQIFDIYGCRLDPLAFIAEIVNDTTFAQAQEQ